MATITPQQRADFIRGYITAALWSSCDTHPETGENTQLDTCEWGTGERTKRAQECEDFITYASDLLLQYAERASAGTEFTTWELAGHDFWLTRNGHGAGFWDRGLDQLGDDLTKATKTFGQIDLYLGDDGLVYS